jgi:hypothetical protein
MCVDLAFVQVRPKTAFCNPLTLPILESEEKPLAEFVKGVWTAFPDFHFKTAFWCLVCAT